MLNNHFITRRFLFMITAIIVILFVFVVANFQSPAIAAYPASGAQAQPNNVQQGDKLSLGKDQIPPVQPNITNSIVSAAFNLSCSNVYIKGVASAGSGYAALRAWDDTTGTTLFDSYVSSPPAPAYYAYIDSGGGFIVNTAWKVFPNPGDSVRVRVYRAVVDAFGSWDSGSYQEQSFTCTGVKYGFTGTTCGQLIASGGAYQASGYVGVRIWTNTQTLYDSYLSGYPSYYAQIGSSGSFYFAIDFPTQPSGTEIRARIYRALSPVPGSWDSGRIDEILYYCQQGTPIPTSTPVN